MRLSRVRAARPRDAALTLTFLAPYLLGDGPRDATAMDRTMPGFPGCSLDASVWSDAAQCAEAGGSERSYQMLMLQCDRSRRSRLDNALTHRNSRNRLRVRCRGKQ